MEYLNIILEPESLFSIALSAKVATVTIILHLFFGIGIAYALSRKKFPFKGLLDAVVTLPLVFPPIAAGFLLLLIFGKNGWFGGFIDEYLNIEIVFGFWGILIASFIAGLPLIVKPVQSAIESSAKLYEEASYMLGKSEWQTFFYVILPNIKKSIAAGLTLSFGRSLGEVGMTLMLGGNIIGKTDTLSLAIYNAVLDGEFDRAIALSAAIALISLAIFFILRRMSVI